MTGKHAPDCLAQERAPFQIVQSVRRVDDLPQRLAVMKTTNRLKIQWPKVEFTVAQLVKLNPSFCELTLRVIIGKSLEAGTLRQMVPIASKHGRPKNVFILTDALTAHLPAPNVEAADGKQSRHRS